MEEGYNTFHERVLGYPRVAVGIVDFDPAAGRLQHVGVRRVAMVAAWDDARASRLLRRCYRRLGGYREPPSSPNENATGRWPMVFVRVDPETVVVREQSYR